MVTCSHQSAASRTTQRYPAPSVTRRLGERKQDRPVEPSLGAEPRRAAWPWIGSRSESSPLLSLTHTRCSRIRSSWGMFENKCETLPISGVGGWGWDGGEGGTTRSQIAQRWAFLHGPQPFPTFSIWNEQATMFPGVARRIDLKLGGLWEFIRGLPVVVESTLQR